MGLVRFCVFWFVVWLTAALPVFAVQATLVADAHVNSTLPGMNSGAISNLNVGGGYTALLQFDLSGLPAGTTAAQVSRAVLRLYCNRLNTAGAVNIQAVGGSWGEYSVTYATLPALGAGVQIVSVNQAGAYVTMDVTALVQGWVSSPNTNYGAALTASTASVQFDSKENDLTGHAPDLEVTLATMGPQGPAGVAGPAGPQGAVGPQGATGAQGSQGIQGSAGAAGAPGLMYRGAYLLTANYVVGDVVLWQGNSYVSLAGGNLGNIPSASPTWWGVLTSQGPAGPTGAMGPQGAAGPRGAFGPIGPQGPVGPAGPTGATGPQGPSVANYRGNYLSATSYALHDAVSFVGSTYISLVEGNLGNSPSPSSLVWAVLTAQGTAGADGATGPQGLMGPAGATGATGSAGPQGPPVSFLGGWLVGTSYVAGSAVSFGGTSYVALIANTGKEPDANPQLWGVLAQSGSPGASGAPGPQGPPGIGVNYRGAWSPPLIYQVNDAVLFDGTTYVALTASLGQEPDSSPTMWAVLAKGGAVGPTGPAGAAATVTVGTVATGAAGSMAVVTNSGTAEAAVLNFTIPQGATGTGGSGGSNGGAGGTPSAAVFHSVSFASIYYSVNSSSGSASETGAVLTWIPNGCMATQLSVFSQQTNPLTVTLRAGMPGSMENTALVCPVTPNQACTVTGSVAVPAGSFVDLNVTGASGSLLSVWTALTCN